jgi:phosphoserine phosphatase RsbX
MDALVACAVAAQAMPGEVESGDACTVTPFPGGVLVAVVDGLGHGPEAAQVAAAAVAALEAHAGEPPIELLRRCHESLRETRGAVVSLASLLSRDGTLTWLAVGNVEGVLLRADPAAHPPRASLVLRGGVVGYHLPPLRAFSLALARGDTLIFATDGLRSRFAEGVDASDTPQQIADGILARHGKGTDDALVLVARYLGGPP